MNNKTIACLLLCASMSLAQIAFAQGPGGRGPGAFARPGGRGPGGPGGFGSEHVVAGAPYSAVEVRQFQDKLGDGNVISRTSQTTLYRDSKGRTRTEVAVTPSAASGKQPFTMITISDPVAGVRYELNSSTMEARSNRIPMIRSNATAAGGIRGNQARSASTSTTTPAVRTGRGGAQITRSELGSNMKNGVLAAGTKETEVLPAGAVGNAQAITVERETWYSSELKRNIQTRTTDPQHGNSSTELTNLVVGEPSASLFTVPANYTVKSAGRGGPGGRGGSGHGGRGPGPGGRA